MSLICRAAPVGKLLAGAMLVASIGCDSGDGKFSLDPGEPSNTYEGYVRATDSGAPVPGITVSLFEESDGEFRFAGLSPESDATGHYSLGVYHCPVSLGQAYLVAECTGLCAGWMDSEPQFITSCEPAVQQFDFELSSQ
jgi:hypothetical protein